MKITKAWLSDLSQYSLLLGSHFKWLGHTQIAVLLGCNFLFSKGHSCQIHMGVASSLGIPLFKWSVYRVFLMPISTPSLPTRQIKGCTTLTGSTPPTLYEQQCGFFYVSQESEQYKSCETRPKVFRPSPRRLECLTICRCHNKASTFSTAILRPECWSSRCLNLWPPTQ